MEKEEIKRILKELADSKENEDKKTWAVLYWKAQGLKHYQIADMWDKSQVWVQRYMTRTHAIFGTTDWNKADKEAFLNNEVYPAIRELIKVDPYLFKEPPPPIKDEYEPSEGPVILVPPPKTPPSPPHPEPPDIIIGRQGRLPGPAQPPRPPFGWIALVVILLGVIGYLGYQLMQRNSPLPAETPENTPVNSPVPTPVSSPLPTQEPATLVPATPIPATDTIPPPTATVPSPTAVLVVPTDGILFQDNFDNEPKSDWNFSDYWITADGALTQTTQATAGNSFSWATLTKPEWKNYILSVKINIPFMFSAAQSPVAVAVRVNGQDKYLGVEIRAFVGNAIFFIGNNEDDSNAVAKSAVFDFESGSTLQIEANGNNFIVSINGRQVQQVSLSGYDSGGIALGMHCVSSLGCPSFDDVKVTYLP